MARITCSCEICKDNAAHVGATFPLQADVPAKMAKAVGAQTHTLVHDAHDPSAIGVAMRRVTGIVPVR